MFTLVLCIQSELSEINSPLELDNPGGGHKFPPKLIKLTVLRRCRAETQKLSVHKTHLNQQFSYAQETWWDRRIGIEKENRGGKMNEL